MRFALIFSLSTLLVTSIAHARTVEPGTLSVMGGLGPGIRLGSKLDAGGAYLLVTGGAEYAIQKSFTAVADLTVGLADTKPLRLHLGGRYRLTGIELPVAPYAQAQLSYGKLYDVLGADLSYWGVRLGGGADYFLTAKIGVGGLVTIDLGRTRSDRPAFYGVIDVLAYATYAF